VGTAGAQDLFEWRVLRAGGFRLDGGGMFGIIPRSMWSRWVEPDAENRIGLAMNCALLERDGAGPGGRPLRVLVEAGAGGKWGDKERAIYEFERAPDGSVRTVEHALAEAGVDPASIDHVVLTHLHFDHAGGLTRTGAAGVLEPVFPNARIHVQRGEWEDALGNRSTMTRTYLRTHLDPVADRVTLHDGAAEPVPGLLLRPAPGHTWHHQAVTWRDALGTVCYPGDVMPTVHHAHPSSSLGYDMLPYRTMLTKRELLEEADAGRWRLVLDHEPGECVVARPVSS
jgi:glyoxylase-like metal-dependent hydrolase (beta-lactamase superfamily II)